MAAWGKGPSANSAPKFITDNTKGETGKLEYGTQVFFVTGDEGYPVSPGWARKVVKGSRTLWESLAPQSNTLGLGAVIPPISAGLGPLNASFTASGNPGTNVIASFTGLDAGEGVIAITPDNGRFALAKTGTQLVKGLATSSIGDQVVTLETSKGRFFIVTLTGLAAGAVVIEPLGRKTLAGVPFTKLAPGSSISGTNTGHFSVAGDGTVSVSALGQTAGLDNSYNFTVTGDPAIPAFSFVTEANTYDVGSQGVTAWNECKAAFNAILATGGYATVDWRVMLRTGVTMSPAFRETNEGSAAGVNDGLFNFTFNGTLVNVNRGVTTNANLDLNAVSYWTGGSFKLGCRTYLGAKIDQTLFVRGKAFHLEGLDFTKTYPVSAIVPNSGILPATAQRGGSGYAATGVDTWFYDSGTGFSCSGALTTTNGAITGGYITSMTGDPDTFAGPISLTNASSGNGIRTSTGTNGYLWIVHDNYSKGGPNTTTDNLITLAGFKQLFIQGQTPTDYATHCSFVISKCRFGGAASKPLYNGRWLHCIFMRSTSESVIEDCVFDGYTQAISSRLHTDYHERRCEFRNIAGDTHQFYLADAPPTNWPVTFAHTTITGSVSYKCDTSGMWSSVHSDGFQHGAVPDYVPNYVNYRDNYHVLSPFDDNAFSAQGFEAGESMFFVGGEISECVVCVNQGNSVMSYRSPPAGDPKRFEVHHNTLINFYGTDQANSASAISYAGALIGIYNPDGPNIHHNIVAGILDSTVPQATVTIPTPGINYAVGDEIWFTHPTSRYIKRGVVATIDGNGGITSITWDNNSRPNGGWTLATNDGLNSKTGYQGSIIIAATGAVRILNAGSGYVTGDTYSGRNSNGTLFRGTITATTGGRIASVVQNTTYFGGVLSLTGDLNNVTAANANRTINNVPSTAGVVVGMEVSHANIPVGATVASFTSNTITLTSGATANVNGATLSVYSVKTLTHSGTTMAANGSGIRTATGSGASILCTAGAQSGFTGFVNNSAAPLNSGDGKTMIVTDNVFTNARKPNTGAVDSLPELLNGPFTLPPTSVAARGYQITYRTDAARNLRADIDNLFRPKPGTPAVGTGHMALRP